MLAALCAGAGSETARPSEVKALPWPMDGPIKVTSTFGEYRNGHFHAGIDLSTFGLCGRELYALAPSRAWSARIDNRGYGNVLTLQQDDGLIVSYAHMKRFAPQVQGAVRALQEEQGHCLAEFGLEEALIRFVPGEAVGLSGSSGVGPPHLHMEIMTPDGEMVNPLRWYTVEDSVPPVAQRVVFTPLSPDALVNGKAEPVALRVRNEGNPSRGDVLGVPQVSGDIGLAVRAHDRINHGGDRVGLYRLTVEIRGEEVFRREYASCPRSQLRLIDLVWDRGLHRLGLPRCERLYKLPGDHLRFHEGSPGDGVLRTGVGALGYGPQTVNVYLEDAAGNVCHVPVSFVVNRPPEVVRATRVGRDTIAVDVRDEEPATCTLTFSVKTGGTWRRLPTSPLRPGVWHVPHPGVGRLMRIVASDERGSSSRPFFLADTRSSDRVVATEVSYELLGNWARVFLKAAEDLARAPLVFVAPGALSYSQAAMWAQDERTYGMELLLFPQAHPGFRLQFFVEGIGGGSGKAELFIPLNPITMVGTSRVSSDDGIATLTAGPDAVFQDTYVVVDRRHLPQPPMGLSLEREGYRFGPESILLNAPVLVSIRVREGASEAGLGLFCWKGGEYRYVPSTYEEATRSVGGLVNELGTFAVLRDLEPPTVRLMLREGATIPSGQKLIVRALVTDVGSGVDRSSVQMYLDGTPVPACPEGVAWVHRSMRDLDPGAHLIHVEAQDLVGNKSSAQVRIRVMPPR